MDDRHDILVKTLIFLGFAMNSQDLRVRPLLRGLPEYHLCVYIYIHLYNIYLHLFPSIKQHLCPPVQSRYPNIPEGSCAHISP